MTYTVIINPTQRNQIDLLKIISRPDDFYVDVQLRSDVYEWLYSENIKHNFYWSWHYNSGEVGPGHGTLMLYKEQHRILFKLKYNV